MRDAAAPVHAACHGVTFACWNPTFDCMRKQCSRQPMLREVGTSVVWEMTVHDQRGRRPNECMVHGSTLQLDSGLFGSVLE